MVMGQGSNPVSDIWHFLFEGGQDHRGQRPTNHLMPHDTKTKDVKGL